VLELVPARSVIDVGCGVGTWLSVFQDHGVEHLSGVDGDYVDQTALEIPRDRFLPFDLEQPLRLAKTFDLVVSLEVAEHLPRECAVTFIDSLTRLGPIVLFSAAIPFQGGTLHVNEQWPDYWAEQFERHDYIAIDCLRRRVWGNEKVVWWYAQNILIFASRSHLDAHPHLKQEHDPTAGPPLRLVHPGCYLCRVERDREEVALMRQLQRATRDLVSLIGDGESFILVDENQWEAESVAPGRCPIPFLEHGGQYWGPPADDATAVRELERLRREGAGYLVVGWPAFWWLDHYAGWHRHLRANYPCVLENDRLVAFDLRAQSLS
jgi:SAM-dependent methyltransferase